MDPLIILKQMARPDSNLEIKDRTWLKIPVPNSFIGIIIEFYLKKVF